MLGRGNAKKGKEQIEAMLRAFSERGIERPRPQFLQEIKNRIPHRLVLHRMDTINIIVDLRISRIAAAAAIIVALVLTATFFGGRDTVGGNVYHDGKLFLKYTLGGEQAYKSEIAETLGRFREALLAQGREVVYYGESAQLNDPHAILMYWRLDEDQYGVIFGDLSARTVSGRTLIRLQSHMLRDTPK